MSKSPLYTLVRHTGWSVGGKSDFEHAVEERDVPTKTIASLIMRKGGCIYDSYATAHQMAHTYNYPRDNTGIVPTAKGRFAKVRGFDEEIFLPG